MSQTDRSKLPIPMPAIQRGCEQDSRGLAAGLGSDRSCRPPGRCSECAPGPDRRCRLRESGDLRWADRDTELQPDGRRRAALQPLPRHGSLLAHAGGASHRAQQPRGRHRHGGGVLDRVPGLHGLLPRRLHPVPEDPAGQRLQHLGLRQVAPDSGWAAGTRGAVQPLAQWLGVRLFLRLPRRRLGAVGSVPGGEPEDHRNPRRLLRR